MLLYSWFCYWSGFCEFSLAFDLANLRVVLVLVFLSYKTKVKTNYARHYIWQPRVKKPSIKLFIRLSGVLHQEFMSQGSPINKKYDLEFMRSLLEVIREKDQNCGKFSRGYRTGIMCQFIRHYGLVILLSCHRYSLLRLFSKFQKPMKGR